MPAPAARYEILPARGTKANLDAAIADIAENELCYATDEEVLYVKIGGVLVATGGSGSVSYGASPPAQPEQGDLWYDINDARLFVYTGTEWADASPDAGNPTVITSDSAPGAPQDGDLWFRTSDGRMYVYYDDGASSQWVDANPATGASNWNYDGTTLTPGTAGTDVDLGTGDLSANSADINGGNIKLNANGTASFNTPTDSKLDITFGAIGGFAQSILQIQDNTGAAISQWRPDRFWLGGTSPSPNVILNADGTAFFDSLKSGGIANVNAGSQGNLTLSTSDGRLKEEVAPLGSVTDKIKALNPVSYKWIDREYGGDKTYLGFIAQEVEPLFPEVIFDTSDGMKGLNYNHLVSPLVKALQESITRIETLESANAALEARLSTLEGN